MSAFNTINGVPASANPLTLRTVLRDEWQWPGVVLSDYDAIRELIPHAVAADLKDAARLAIEAGVDMDMMSHAYSGHLAELLDEGAVSAAVIDEAVRRVLRLKVALGLFEHPYADEGLAGSIILRDDYRALALEVAQKSMVLLKNENDLLPLAPDVARLAVVGPLADDRAAMLGTWAAIGRAEDAETVLEGIQALWQGGKPPFVAGCPAGGDGPADIAAAVAAAQAADVVIAVVGETADMSGEAHSRAHLGLPGRQQDLVDALAATGKPLVVVLMAGRPLVIPRLAEQAGALLLAWHGGIRAGRAVGDLLFGAAVPSGKLTTTFPRAEGQIAIHYDRLPTGRPPEGGGTKQFEEPYKSTYMDEPNTPLFPFGYGLSYACFAYRDLVVRRRVPGGMAQSSCTPLWRTRATGRAKRSCSAMCAISSPALAARSGSSRASNACAWSRGPPR